MKIIVLFFLKITGVISAARFSCRSKIIIFSLHGVMDEMESSFWVPLRNQISRNTLDTVLGVLSKYYNFISLDDAVEMLEGKRELVPYSVVLTFDDGYRNNITHALPILQKHNMPATFYLATGYVGNKKPYWFDRLDYALQKGNVDGMTISIAGQTLVINASSRDALNRSYKKIRNLGKSVIRDDAEMVGEMEGLAVEIEKSSGKSLQDILRDDPWCAILKWDEVQAAEKINGVSFGSHTVEHVRLGLVSDEKILDELTHSKSAIEDNLETACTSFCYPIGSYNAHVAELVQKCGYTSAVTTVKGVNQLGCDIMMLRRLPFPNTCSPVSILFIASGLPGVYKRIKGIFRRK